MHNLLTQGGKKLVANGKALRKMVERYPERHLLGGYSDERLMQMVGNYRENELSNIGINFKGGSFRTLERQPRSVLMGGRGSKQRFKHIIDDLQRSRQVLAAQDKTLPPRVDFENLRIRAIVDKVDNAGGIMPPRFRVLRGELKEMVELDRAIDLL